MSRKSDDPQQLDLRTISSVIWILKARKFTLGNDKRTRLIRHACVEALRPR